MSLFSDFHNSPGSTFDALDLSSYSLRDFVDVAKLEELLEEYNRMTGVALAVVDSDGELIVEVGLLKICEDFHRVNEKTCVRCLRNERCLDVLDKEDGYVACKCQNGFQEMASSIRLGGRCFGTLFMGQFFYQDEPFELDFFLTQIEENGFDRVAYLDALTEVPRLSREQVIQWSDSYARLTRQIAEMGYQQLKILSAESQLRAAVESQLRESQNRFERLVENSPDLFYSFSNKRGIIYCSHCLESLLGFTIEEIKIDPFLLFYRIHPDDLAEVQLLMNNRLLKEEHVLDYRIQHKDGHWLHVKDYWISHKFLGDEVIIEGFVRDVSDQINYESQLKELISIKDRIFSVVAHDLINPFNAILSMCGLQEEAFNEKDDLKARNYGRMIYTSAQSAYDILNNLLAWSRLQMGKVQFNPDEVIFHDLVIKTVRFFTFSLKNKSIQLDIEMDQGLIVNIDPHVISVVLRNLLANAIKFSYNNGCICIRAYKADGRLFCYVQDEGVGVADESIKTIFDLDSNRQTVGTDHEKGTGLGLIICREFIQLHDGCIAFETGRKKGSCVYFSVPCVKR